MAKSARSVRSTPSLALASEPAPRRQPSTARPLVSDLANTPLGQLQALIDTSPKVEELRELAGVPVEAASEIALNLHDRQQVTYEVLIDRFGSEIGLSLDLYNKVSEGRADEMVYVEYQEKCDALTKRVQQFYREVDVAELDEISERDLDVLITMLSTGFAVTQSQTTHISKVMNNKGLQSRLADAIANKPVSISGYIGSTESTEALSPQQQITTLGLDYEYVDRRSENKEKRTDFLLQTGIDDQGKTVYEPIPQTSYMKMPYTQKLKEKTRMTVDVRLYEKILERAERSQAAGIPLSVEDLTIVAMAKEIAKASVCLKYRTAESETDEEAASKCVEFGKKFNSAISADRPPFTGLGFSAYGERISSGFMNMYPEMNISVKLDQDNYQDVLGEDSHVEFFTKFASSNNDLNNYNPDGSTDVLIGRWDGKNVSIPDQAEEMYENNFKRVSEKFSSSSKNTSALAASKLVVSDLKTSLSALKA